MSVRQRIDPIRPRLHWHVLSDADVERLDDAITETLADVGARFPLAKAIDAMRTLKERTIIGKAVVEL